MCFDKLFIRKNSHLAPVTRINACTQGGTFVIFSTLSSLACDIYSDITENTGTILCRKFSVVIDPETHPVIVWRGLSALINVRVL